MQLIRQLSIIAFISLCGCATQKSIKFTETVCPPDKALVYVYWARWIRPLHTVEIDVGDEPRIRLHTGGYYPLIFNPGSVSLGYSQLIPPEIYLRNTNALQLNV